MKQVICDNQALENADYQRLLGLKAKGNKTATELVEIFETSPEVEVTSPDNKKPAPEATSEPESDDKA
ncbi:hypothetical protein [Klebsiella pneumoniae]|nr:hypothetical protein [Klebsiella pneumoniae]MDD1879026.1 hypothetical protein [Klebsiella pneumoniae]HCD2737239.1 hypothetical protein [Klebsiella pneumoniae]